MIKHKILFVMHDLGIGGAERVILNLVNNIDTTSFEVTICLFSNKGALVSQIRNDIRIHNLNTTRVLFGIHKLFFLLLEERPKIVFSSITHVNAVIGFITPVYKLFNKQTFFINREVNNPTIRANQQKKSRRLDCFYKQAIHNFDLTIAQSKSMKKDLNIYYKLPKHKIKVVHNPVNHSHIESQLKGITKEQVFNNELVNIVAVGNLRKQKGYDRLIEIISNLKIDYHLYIIGEGTERKKINSLIKANNLQNKVSLLGTQKNPYKYMKYATVVVSTSIYEGFPNSIIEANACGSYVIAFKCPGIDNELIKNKINGTLIKEDNFDEYQNELNCVVNREIDSNKIIETSMRFDISKIVSEYQTLFRTLLTEI